MNLTNIWFYIQDPSDQRGTITTATGTTLSLISDSEEWVARQSNGAKIFVGISVQNDFLGQIIWDVSGGGNYDNDGYGLDDFHTVASVPQPATMLFLGAGLFGLAGFGRKKFIKK